MSATAASVGSYLSGSRGILSWVLSTDHKRIGWLYLVSIILFFAVGAVGAALVRLELITPQGDLLSPDRYNQAFTLHGVLMVWFFLIPSIPATLGNFLLPLMIGARDLAFPRLNLLSWWIFAAGGLFTLYALTAGAVDTGWTFYTPYSTLFSNGYVAAAVAGVFIVGFSSILTGLNFIVTLHTMRAPGMGWFRMPLFLWALYATSIILVLATPVLAVTLLLLALERVLGLGVFDPELGGDPLLFQHLFWFYSHPAVYIMILPGMGVVSEVIACFSRNSIFGYRFIAYSSMAIALAGFLVWGHHMFVSGQGMYAGVVFSLLSFFVAVPSAIKVFNWTATLYKGHIRLDAPMLYTLTFIFLFGVGGVTGIMLATLGLNVHVHDTYFVISHFHYIMVGGMVTAFLAGLHFWWPKMTGRMYPEKPARVAAGLAFLGFNLTFLPQFWLGYMGMPRRYHSYPEEFQMLHVLSSSGTLVLALAYLMPLVYLIWSLRRGRRAGDNPWEATGLEWRTPSPPPEENFDRPVRVEEEPYAYRRSGGSDRG